MRSRTSKLLSALCVFAMLLSIVPMPPALAADETLSYTASFDGGTLPTGTIYTFSSGCKFGTYKAGSEVAVTIPGTAGEAPTTLSFSSGLKMQSGTLITFTAPSDGTLTLYCNSGSKGYTMTATPTVNGAVGTAETLTVAQDSDNNYTASFKTVEDAAYEIAKLKSESQVVYIVWTPDAPPTKAGVLTKAIAAATATATQWAAKVDTDGSNTLNTEKWVTQAALDTYHTAITEAQNALAAAGENVDDASLDTAKAALDAATANFVAAQKTGTKEPVAGALTYSLTATQKSFQPMGDKDLIPKGPVFLSPYFTANWDDDGSNEGLQYRDPKASIGACALEVGKASGKNGLEFTVESTATVVITFCSTDAENVSVIGLLDTQSKDLVPYSSFTGPAVDASETAAVTAGTILKCGNGKTGTSGTGTTSHTVTYTDLSAGTYRICSPAMPPVAAETPGRENYANRGVRLREVTVTEASALAKADLQSVVPKSVKIETYPAKASLRLAVGEAMNLTMVLGGAGAGETYGDRSGSVWASSSADVATVKAPEHKKIDGAPAASVTAVAPGKTTISVVIGGVTHAVEVEVYEVTAVDVTCAHGFAHHELDLRGDTETVQMNAAVTPANAKETGVEWSIAPTDPGISIDANGLVTVLPTVTNQEYTITAKSKEANSTVEGIATLKVCKPVIKSFQFEGGATAKTIKMGQTLDLAVLTEWFKATDGPYYIAPAEGTASAVNWQVSDETVATLDSGTDKTDGKAVVTPKKVGEVTITATSARDNTKTAQLKLTVGKGDVNLTIQARNNEVTAAGNTIELLVSGMPEGLDPVVTIERKGTTGTPGGDPAVTKQDSAADGKAWNYQATLPANSHTTEDLVYTVTASFAGDDNWNAATAVTVELTVRNTGAKIIRITAYPNGGNGVTITSGGTLDMAVQAEMRETNPDGSLGQVVEGDDGVLTYTWARADGKTLTGTSSGNSYQQTGALVADSGVYTCTISAANVAGVHEAVANITVRVNKKTTDAPAGIQLETFGRVLSKLNEALAAHPDDDAKLQYSLDNERTWTDITVEADGTYAIPEQENPSAVNGLDIRFAETAETEASPVAHTTLTRATPPALEGADQKIVITSYNPLFKDLYQISTDDGASWSDVAVTVVGTTAEITGLTNGTKYSVKVKYGGHVLGSLEHRDATPKANKTALAAAIAAADADYNTEIRVSPDGRDVLPTIWWVTAEERDALHTAIGTAQAVYDKVDATQDQVDAATAAITAAQKTYDDAKELGRYVDKELLKEAIDAAQDEHDSQDTKVSDDGLDVPPDEKWVDPTEKKDLTDAIEEAQKVYDDPDATADEVEQAIKDINKAVEDFENAKEPGKKPILYNVTAATTENGTVTFTVDDTAATQAAAGKTVTVVTVPAAGYKVDTITVKAADNSDVTVTDKTFTMPAQDVTVTVTFKPGVNADGLKESIEKAKDKETGVETSADGSDIDKDKTWVTPEDKKKLDDEIAKAEEVLKKALEEDPAITQEDVDQAKETLDQAIEDFQPKPGTKTQSTGGGGRRPGGTVVDPKPQDEEEKRHYVDLDDHWGEDDAYFVSDRDIFNGTDETHFSPDMPMNRAMMATVIYRMNGKPSVTGTVTFQDVDMHTWYTDALVWGANAKTVVLKGYSVEAFGPEDPITREQLAAMLYRYADLKGMVKGKAAPLTYADSDQVSDWAYEAMAWMTEQGLFIGRNGNVVDPLANATRAEVATVLARFVRFSEK